MHNATTQLSKVLDLLAQAQAALADIHWNSAQVGNAPLGEHLNALDQHLDNAVGRCSTVARAASKLA